MNAQSARVDGLELNLYQPFSFLPEPFNGFGVDVNLTRINSQVIIPTRPGADLPFFRQPGKIANLTLFYEKGKFQGRVALTYSDSQLYTLGSAPLSDIYRIGRRQYDLQLRYRLTNHLSVTGSVRNLSAEPEQFEYGPAHSYLMRTSRQLGRDYKLGFSMNY